MPRTLIAALTLAAVVLSGCGDKENALSTSEDKPSASSDTVTCDSFEADVESEVAKDGTPEPFVPAKPVDELCVHDVTVGDGDEITQADADAGTEVEVNYVGVGQQTKKTFDSSFDRGMPTTFPLNGVIEGWTKGLVGMKVGGRRQITIPGDLAYGEAGRDGIEPNETLVFVVDLVSKAAAAEPIPEPELTIPDAPATELGITDITPGTGAEITADMTGMIEVHLLGRSAVNKVEIVNSYATGEALQLPYPVTQVPNGGLTQGLVGMKVGGRRQIVIPGTLGYGATPPEQAGLDPDETLVFVVDLVAVN